MKPDGGVAGNSKAQVGQAWKNVIAVLKSANMSTEDLVRVNVYITEPADVELNRASWKKISKNGGPAITMVTVKRLSHPDWTVEIEAIAAKAEAIHQEMIRDPGSVDRNAINLNAKASNEICNDSAPRWKIVRKILTVDTY